MVGRSAWLSLLALVIVAGGGAALATPRFVKKRAVSEAARRGVLLDVGSVRVGWFHVSLEDVDAQLDGVEGLDARFGNVQVAFDHGLHPTEIVAGAGSVTAHDDGTLLERIKAWREGRKSGGPPSDHAQPSIEVVLDDVAWTARDHALSANGLHLRRRAERSSATVEVVRGSSGKTTVTAKDIELEGGEKDEGKEVHVAAAEVAWVTPRLAEERALAPAEPLAPTDLPAEKRGRGRKGRRKPAPEAEAAEPLPQLLPDLHAMRGEVAALVKMLADKVPEGASLKIDALDTRVQKGDDSLTLGSGPFTMERDAQKIALTFSSSSAAQATPLALHLELPTGPGDVELRVSGGPAPLSMLGMRDGGLLHLLDTEHTMVSGRGRVVLDDKGTSLGFDASLAVHGLSFAEPKIARDPVRGLDVGVEARGLLDDKGELRLDEADATLGAGHATLHGGMAQTPDHLAAAFDFEFPTASCQALLTSLPKALVPTIADAHMDGTFGLKGRLAFDTRNYDAASFDYDVQDHCRLTDVPEELDKDRYAHTFTHAIYTAKGDLTEETTGPGTPGWTDLADISPFMQVAVLTTEDGMFYRHHGFSHGAIRKALLANLKAHRFIRGASTITMQLAKNLFLTREKTLARKLEELILADYLEQTFTKEEMMELYLNVIEFGPDVYGITAAADHYFGRKPAELNLAECMFLSSILPNPIGFHRVYDKGSVPDGWMKVLHAHMEVAAGNGLLTQAELAEGLTEQVTFHKESDPPVAPRPPAVAQAFKTTDEAEWQELN